MFTEGTKTPLEAMVIVIKIIILHKVIVLLVDTVVC